MKTVNEVCKISGVTIRTLHHYDAIGLLKPSRVSEAGYRLYDDAAIARLQSILLLRELDFSLKEIKSILDDPDFVLADALEQQIRLLKLQKGRIDKLIALAENLKNKGDISMDFSAFDNKEIEQYKDEVRQRWGNTEAYKEYEKKAQGGIDYAAAQQGMAAIFAELGKLRHLSPADDTVKEKVSELQQFISEHFYTCTNEILLGLGQMYVADDRFAKNIDQMGGAGTAEFAARAIEEFCEGK